MKQQTIFRTVKQTKFTTVDNSPYSDTTISFKAKGILIYLLSKPNNWEANIEDLRKQSTDGKDSVKSGLKELETAGYIKRYQAHSSDGTFGKIICEVYEGKCQKTPQAENPLTDKPSTDIPLTENPLQVNTELKLKTDELKTEKETVVTRPEIPIVCFDIADSLINFVKTAYNVTHTSHRKQWADMIRKMSTIDKIDLETIKRGVSWYVNLEEYPKYCPKIHSATDLRKKWTSLINYSKTLENKANANNSINQQAMNDVVMMMNKKQPSR